MMSSLHLAFEAPQSVLKRLTFLNDYFCQAEFTPHPFSRVMSPDQLYVRSRAYLTRLYGWACSSEA